MNDKRVRIFTGHYGSGKTEVAVNYAMNLAKQDKKIAFADMDIVNVYFRSREVRDKLEENGVYMLDSSINTSVELPSLPGENYMPFSDDSFEYIVDLGGNDVGITVLLRYKEVINIDEVSLFMVVNAYRPATNTVEGILAEKEALEAKSGMKITGFINNTNLARETTFEDLVYGDKLLNEVFEICKVPIVYTTYVKEVVSDVRVEELSGEVISMDFFMRKEWM